MRARNFLLSISMMIAMTGCGTQDGPTSDLNSEARLSEPVRKKIGAAEILDVIAKAKPEQPAKLPDGVSAADLENALADLEKKVKPKANDNSKLEVDAEFEKSLTPDQKGALKKLSAEFENKVKQGKLKVTKKPDGTLNFEEPGEKNNGSGDAKNPRISLDDETMSPRHSTGNGYWSWSYTTHWWGHKLSVNHNFLYYLCSYTSWMLDRSGLPSWAKSVLRILLCLPHSADGGADGSTIYVTWALAFWYSP